jgi:hypothetical protein
MTLAGREPLCGAPGIDRELLKPTRSDRTPFEMARNSSKELGA